MTEEIPKDSSHTRLVAVVASVVVIVLVAGGFALWALTRPRETGPGQKSIEPAQETSVAPLPGVVASSSVESTSTTPSSAATPAGVTERPSTATETVVSRRIAFTLGATLYVSDVSGADISPVTGTADAYSLSPDSSKLAVVLSEASPSIEDATSMGRIAVIDVASQAIVLAGADAVGYPVSWAPDSSWFAYSAFDGDQWAVRRVDASGANDRVIAMPGVNPQVSRDGRYVAYRTSAEVEVDEPLSVVTVSSRKKRTVPGSKGAFAYAWGAGERLYFTRQVASPQDWSLWLYGLGSSSREVGSVALDAPAYALHDLRVSPDGKKLLMAASGDDHYSRLWVFHTGAERFSAIETRRDAYPCCWANDDQILYFEGNAYQSEPSVLVSILADGTGRRLIITGAQR